MSILIAILGFNLLVLVHELGHFLVARASGMRVLKFSIGFGPAILKVTKGETVYQFAAFPIGGFVQVDGLMGDVDRENPPPGTYLSRPLWQRAAMVSAGPIANFLLAILVYVYLFGTFNALRFEGRADPTPTINKVEGAAEKAGILPYDTVVAIGGEPIKSFNQIRAAVGESEGEAITLTVARSPDGTRPPLVRRSADKVREGLIFAWPTPPEDWPRHEITVTPERDERGLKLGISPDLARFGGASFGATVSLSVAESYAGIKMVVLAVRELLRGSGKAKLASPVKVTEMGADSVKMGSEWFLNLLALLSLNLGLLNLLPLPALDGGRLMFIAAEAVARRSVPRRLEGAIHAAGMVLLLGLIAVVTITDIASYF